MKSCLIVDDSKVVRMVARKILEGLHFAIEEADNGQTAMDQCIKRILDAILLDWNMPVMSGLLTKTLETEADIKVVSTVGNGQAAIDALKRLDVDVVVLDIEMPVMDGLTALPKMLEARPGVQVIMASTLTLKGASVSMKA